MSDNKNVFSFRLPIQYMEWFNDHIPEGQDNRHKAMLALVVQTIEDKPDFQLAHDDPMQKMESRILNRIDNALDERDEMLRNYVRSFIQSNGNVLAQMVNANQAYQSGGMGDSVPDDLIDNILEGM